MKNQDQENKFYNLTAQETNPPVTPNNNAPFPSPMPVTPNNQPTTLEEGTSPLPTFSMPSGPFFSETTVTEPTFTPTPIGKAYIRFLHSAPGSPAVDIYVNNSLIARNINYNDFTEYFTALPGTYIIQIYATDRRVRPLLTVRVNLINGMIYTAAVVGEPNDIQVELITDRPRSINPNYAYMRFINLSPDSSPLDVYIDDQKVLSGILYKEVSNYLTLQPGSHSIVLKIAATDEVVLRNPKAILRGGVAYATYIVGYMYKTPGLQVLIPMEGITYLTF